MNGVIRRQTGRTVDQQTNSGTEVAVNLLRSELEKAGVLSMMQSNFNSGVADKQAHLSSLATISVYHFNSLSLSMAFNTFS